MKYVVMYDRENIRLYDEENGFEPVSIGGECIHPYELTRAKNSIGSIIEELAKEYNLEPSEDEEGTEYYPEISFRILKCSDKEIDKVIHSVFMAYSCSYIELNKIIDVLYEDIVDSGKDKLALENGINFNGINYCKVRGDYVRREFNLLAFTIKNDVIASVLPKLKEN